MALSGTLKINIDVDEGELEKAKKSMKDLDKTGKTLEGTGKGIGASFKSIFGGMLAASVVTSGFNAIKSGLGGLMSEMSEAGATWQTFQGNMSQLGWPQSEINAAKADMQAFAEKTIYSSSEMSATFSQLAAVGVKNTSELVKGFGGLAAASNEPKQAMKTLSQQATQMAAKPQVAWQDFRLMLEQTPAGIAAVAKTMGKSTTQLVSDVQAGTVSTEEFFDAIAKTGTNANFSEMATQFKTVGQAIDGAKENLANKLMPAFGKLNEFGIKSVVAVTEAFGKINFDKLAKGLEDTLGKIDIDGVVGKISASISNLASKVQTFWKAFSNTGALQAFGSAISNTAAALGNVFNSLTTSGVLKALAVVIGNVVKWLSLAVSAVSKFVSALDPKVIQVFSAAILGIVTSMKALNFIKGFKISNLFGKIKIKNPFTPLVNFAKGAMKSITSAFSGLGKGISNIFKGIGKGISVAFRGIASSLSMLNPAGMAAFAIGVGAVTAALLLLSSMSGTVLPFLQGLADIVGGLLVTAMTGFANALLILSPIMPIIAQSLAMLSPLVTAFGTALTSIIAVLPPVIEALASGISEIVTAITPIVAIIGDVFTQVVQIVANAIVQIVQALAPFLPAVTVIVEALAPILSQVIDAFNNLINNVSPIIDSLTNLLKTFGEQVSSILESAGSVVESFGNSIRTVLDGVAGIFESMGNAAKNAGQGVKLMAEGIKMLVDLKLGDLTGTLAAVATGLGKVASHATGLASAGSGMQLLASSMSLFSSSSVQAIVALTLFSSKITSLSATISELPAILSAASSAFASFAAPTLNISSFLIAISSIKSAYATLAFPPLVIPAPIITIFLASLALLISFGMAFMSQMAIIGMKSGQVFSKGLDSGGKESIALMRSIISAVTSAANSGVAPLYSIGRSIGLSLADGLRSAYAAVAAAASSLVAEANKAAKAKASIGSLEFSFDREYPDQEHQLVYAGVKVPETFSFGAQNVNGRSFDKVGKKTLKAHQADEKNKREIYIQLNGKTIAKETVEEITKLQKIKEKRN